MNVSRSCIWENGHAHTSQITVSPNDFKNLAAGNDPALNLQRAFRVTSHSSAATTVTYSGNTVHEANIGMQWIASGFDPFTAPVKVTGNSFRNAFTCILVQAEGRPTSGATRSTASGPAPPA